MRNVFVMQNRAAALVIASILSLCTVPALFGKGPQDETLSRADELIAEKQYDQAIALLTDFARKNPKQFDQAQTRIRKIVLYREEYNSVAQQLLTVVKERPEDDESIVQLSNKLRELDPNRGAETQNFINSARMAALFNVNKARLEGILTR